MYVLLLVQLAWYWLLSLIYTRMCAGVVKLKIQCVHAVLSACRSEVSGARHPRATRCIRQALIHHLYSHFPSLVISSMLSSLSSLLPLLEVVSHALIRPFPSDLLDFQERGVRRGHKAQYPIHVMLLFILSITKPCC